jgi:hypothetical protein
LLVSPLAISPKLKKQRLIEAEREITFRKGSPIKHESRKEDNIKIY